MILSYWDQQCIVLCLDLATSEDVFVSLIIDDIHSFAIEDNEASFIAQDAYWNGDVLHLWGQMDDFCGAKDG